MSVATSHWFRDRVGSYDARLLNPINESFRESWEQVKQQERQREGFVLRVPGGAIDKDELSAVAVRRGVSLDEATAEAEAEGFQVSR